MGALWIFGIVVYAMAVPIDVADPGGLESLSLLWYGRPGVFLLGMTGAWVVLAGVIYAMQRMGRRA